MGTAGRIRVVGPRRPANAPVSTWACGRAGSPYRRFAQTNERPRCL